MNTINEKRMRIINLTPHTINEVTTGNSYEPSGIVARVKSSTEKIFSHDGVPIYKSRFGSVEGLPEPSHNTLYIVSALALNAIPSDRHDVVAPGSVMRSEKGIILGCCGFRAKSD